MSSRPQTAASFCFIIAGPTAVGKSQLAVTLAERCGAEIVGADAFQVYAGLDLLTAKPSAEARGRVPHHLVGEVPLTERYDVSRYLGDAARRIAEIRARNRQPILVGGTGLYLRALMRGLSELPASDPGLRAKLDRQPLAELQRRLAERDPAGAAAIDLQNPRRVIRALEICLLTQRPFSAFRAEWDVPVTGIRGIVFTRERAELNTMIERRTKTMFDAGVVEEVRTAGEIGPTAGQAIGLREVRALLAGEMSRSKCMTAITIATRHYAKRQMTWFRREPALTPVHLTGNSDLEPLLTQLAAAMAGR